jgi:hypothetical protein
MMIFGRKIGLLSVLSILSVVWLGVILTSAIMRDREGSRQVRAVQEPRVLKIKEVVGRVVGGPQIVTGSPLIGYAVYVEELKGMRALHATQCPLIESGQRVVMYQKDTLSDWYTFLRLR